MKKETQLDVLKEIRDLLKAQHTPAPISSTPAKGWNVVHIPQGLTIEAALAECTALFPVWRWADGNLDNLVTSDRSSKEAYTISFKECIEADAEQANKSANEIQGLITITLLERIVLELHYFKETGQHLDIDNITLCAGSRYADGLVPGCHWGGGGFGVGWADAGGRRSDLRARVAVS